MNFKEHAGDKTYALKFYPAWTGLLNRKDLVNPIKYYVTNYLPLLKTKVDMQLVTSRD